VRIHVAGKVFAVREDIAAALAAGLEGSGAHITGKIAARRSGAVAVVPFMGFVTKRGGPYSEFFGDAPLELFQARLSEAAADPDVTAIVVKFDSPGGEVFGVTETAAFIRRIRVSKPIVALADSMAASAAYWLAAQADQLIVTPSGEVGSIGVYGMHVDLSGVLEKAGAKVTLISAGKYKTEGSPYGPLGADAAANMQRDVDRHYGMFVADVAKGRKTSAVAVRMGFGEGRMVGAEQAVPLGMADSVGSLGDALQMAAELGLARAKYRRDRSLAAARLEVADLRGDSEEIIDAATALFAIKPPYVPKLSSEVAAEKAAMRVLLYELTGRFE
jgi:signal peptide peptidase SppA